MEKPKIRSNLLLFQTIKEVPSKKVGYTTLLILTQNIHYSWLNISSIYKKGKFPAKAQRKCDVTKLNKKDLATEEDF